MNLKPACWNEYDEIKSVIVCSPSTLSVPTQKTADYIQWEKPVEQEKAIESFHKMTSAIEKAGAKVFNYAEHLPAETLPFHNELVNRVFVRDLACAFGTTLLPGAAGITMRQPEYVHSHRLFQQWFERDVFLMEAIQSCEALEYGDVLILNKDAVFINAGLRTSIHSIRAMLPFIFAAGFTEIGIIDLPRMPDTLHLDMNGNVAGPGLFISKSYVRFFPVLVVTERTEQYQMSGDFLKRHGYEVIWTDDVKHTVADVNFLNLNPETILISTKHNKNLFKHPLLSKKQLIEVDVDELEKGGGGIRCMTLPVSRG